MFLKSLDIFGFKSFADRTHIDFADGITALLGPNGCGKSNVVDAIKWVLAENKMKNLRAEKKEDVIFNGTETRPPLNVAEVTITMSNENGLLPLEESEIAIKRRLFRSGENEYFINNRPAGTKEITKLFMDTGIGKSAYSVMEQGKITQIISSKPEDRRYIFEEAAGISASKAECAIAEQNLARTRLNMQQIEIAMAEIKRSYDTLKVQAEKAKKYHTLKDEIFENELDIALLRLKNFVTDKTHHENDLAEATKKRDAVRNEIEEIQAIISENVDKVKEMQDKVYEMQNKLIEIQTEKRGKLDLVNQFNSQSREIKEKIGVLEVRQKSIQEKIDGIQDEIDENEATIYEHEKQLSDIQKNIENFKENINTASSQITQNDAYVAENKTKIASLNDSRVALQNELAEITEDIVKMLDAKLKEAGFSENAVREAKTAVDNDIGKLKIFVEGRKNIFSDFASSNHSENDYKNAINDAVVAFNDANHLTKNLESSLQNYIKTSPNFILEFLSPEGIMTKKRAVDAKIQENLSQIDAINKNIDELGSTNVALTEKINEYKDTLSHLHINETKMTSSLDATRQQITIFKRSLASEKSNLTTANDELEAENRRFANLNEQIVNIQSELSEIEVRGVKLADELKVLDEKIAESNSNVLGKKDKLDKKREEQNKYQGQVEKLTLALNSDDMEIRNIKLNFQEQHSRDLIEFEERMYKIHTTTAELREKLAEKREELKNLGQVNLMAESEFAEVKDRYERQKTNYEDTQKSLENLVRVSEEIRSKSSEMFIEAYNKIKKNFHNMFRRLFNGGKAELHLEDPENILTSGIEIMAQPPGKNVKTLSLLSGGEQSMTAVALLFAMYQVRPSPFCLLDEIDAALDDRNVSSFKSILESFSKVSQFLIITHNKKTVMGTGTMLGISMEESGVSKILGIRLSEVANPNADETENTEEFIEEDVPPEENVYLPPRPPKRVYSEDGAVTE